jgi:hypothetical protein
MPSSLPASLDRPPAAGYVPQVIVLGPGVAVGHANPRLADWAGVIEADSSGQWHGTDDQWPGPDDVRVRWTDGTSARRGPLACSQPGWHASASITVKGQCPGCGRAAHYIAAGNQHGRAEGWHHDARIDADTCWAGKAAFEATLPGHGPGSTEGA